MLSITSSVFCSEEKFVQTDQTVPEKKSQENEDLKKFLETKLTEYQEQINTTQKKFEEIGNKYFSKFNEINESGSFPTILESPKEVDTEEIDRLKEEIAQLNKKNNRYDEGFSVLMKLGFSPEKTNDEENKMEERLGKIEERLEKIGNLLIDKEEESLKREDVLSKKMEELSEKMGNLSVVKVGDEMEELSMRIARLSKSELEKVITILYNQLKKITSDN